MQTGDKKTSARPKKTPKRDLSEYEEEKTPLDDVLRQLLQAKPLPKKEPKAEKPDEIGPKPDHGNP